VACERSRANYWSDGCLAVLEKAASIVIKRTGTGKMHDVERDDLVSEGWLETVRYFDGPQREKDCLGFVTRRMFTAYKRLHGRLFAVDQALSHQIEPNRTRALELLDGLDSIPLRPRQRRVLALLAQGDSQEETARMVGMHRCGVKYVRDKIAMGLRLE